MKGGFKNKKIFSDFKSKVDKLKKDDMAKFYDYASKQIALRFLSRVILDTPVEENKNVVYKTIRGRAVLKIRGGDLRRSWTSKDPKKRVSQTAYVESMKVIKQGRIFSFTITNYAHHASYVEYGHRQNVGQFVPYIGDEVGGVMQGARLKKAWVKGQFMMERAADAINSYAPALAQKLIYEYLKENF